MRKNLSRNNIGITFADAGAGPKPQYIERRRPARPEDQALVELESNDPTGEAWQVMRSDLSEGRDLGQINIQRFHGGMPWIRIPAFFNLPVALTPADLNAGDADVAIMGAEFYNSAPVQSYAPTPCAPIPRARSIMPGAIGRCLTSTGV